MPQFQRGADNAQLTTSKVLTDAAARKDFAALERAIERHHGGTKTAKGAYEATALPDDGALGRLAAAWGADIRGFRVTGDSQTFGFFNGVYSAGTAHTVSINENVDRLHYDVVALPGEELRDCVALE